VYEAADVMGVTVDAIRKRVSTAILITIDPLACPHHYQWANNPQ